MIFHTLYSLTIGKRVASIAALALLSLAGCSGSDSVSTVPDFLPPGTPSTPTISGTPPTSVQATLNYSFTPSAADRDSKPLSFQIDNQPAWANFDATTGRLSGIPSAAQVGTYPGIVIRVTDGTRSAALPAFTIQVTPPPNLPPTINGTPATSVQAGMTYTFQPTAFDPENQALTFTIENAPSWATFTSSNGRLSGTPNSTHAGMIFDRIVISVSDGVNRVSLPAFSIVVTSTGNNPPTISGTPATSVQVGAAYSFTPTASDPDGNALTFSIVNRPSWAQFSTTTGALTGTPTAVGTHSGVTIRVSDGQVMVSLQPFTIQVTSGNRPPVISGTPATTAPAGSAYVFTPTASDPDGDPITFLISNPPAWATFSSTTGTLSGTPTPADARTYNNIVISVRDSNNNTTSLQAFAIVVTQQGNGSATLTWTAPTLNTDDTPLTNLSGYTIYYGTNSASLTQRVDVGAGALTTQINGLNSGTYYFSITARNPTEESRRSNLVSKVVP